MPGGGKDLYAVLGLRERTNILTADWVRFQGLFVQRSLVVTEPDASDGEIKKGYHKMALVHHPDKHAGDGEDAVAVAEQKFKEIGEAYAVLSDVSIHVH